MGSGSIQGRVLLFIESLKVRVIFCIIIVTTAGSILGARSIEFNTVFDCFINTENYYIVFVQKITILYLYIR